MAKLLTKDEGLAFRKAEQALFERGVQFAQTTPKTGQIDLRGLITAFEQHLKIPTSPADRALVLKSQGDLRQLIAGYITGCEKKGMLQEGLRHAFDAYEIALKNKLESVRNELSGRDGPNSGILNDSSFRSIASNEGRVHGIEEEAKAAIRKERPTLRGGTLFDNAVTRALETDPRWAKKYAEAKRSLEAAREAARKLEAMAGKLRRALANIAEIKKVRIIDVNHIAKSLAEVVEPPRRIISTGRPETKAMEAALEARIPTNLKIVGATAAALAVAGALVYLYMRLTEAEEPKVPKKTGKMDF